MAYLLRVDVCDVVRAAVESEAWRPFIEALLLCEVGMEVDSVAMVEWPSDEAEVGVIFALVSLRLGESKCSGKCSLIDLLTASEKSESMGNSSGGSSGSFCFRIGSKGSLDCVFGVGRTAVAFGCGDEKYL